MLTPGTRIGPYEVHALIGQGGMGEVYRARDARLGRDVALKVLPAVVAADSDRLARFEREARTLASLNHPSIAHIHGLEEFDTRDPSQPAGRALVMELVDGEDLADRLRRGPIPLAEAIALARPIADALEAAHELGVVHRDLKPANIKVRPDGTLKLLDFGLAKTVALEGAMPHDASLLNSPTITSPAMTMRGVILGTAAYMSPEQARGKPVDRRTDVWAFGVVLYEMLTGRRLFDGDDATAVIAQIIEREPDWSALPAATPESVRRLLRRCLEKDRRRRLRDCGDAVIELDAASTAEAVRSPQPRPAPVVIAGLVGMTVGAIAVALMMGRSTAVLPPPAGVATFPLVQATDRLTTGGRLPLTIAPDGRRIVYTANEHLMLRTVEEFTSREVDGTQPTPLPAGIRGNTGLARQPIVSPDGTQLAFFQGAELKRIPVAGGIPTVICTCGDALGATWSIDDSILYAGGMPTDGAAIWRIAAAGGTPELLIKGDQGQTFQMPQRLPDGDHVLFTSVSGEHWDDAEVVVQSPRSGARQVLIQGAVDGRYVPSGHLVFGRGGALHAVRFDPDRLQVVGKPVPVLAGVSQVTSSGGWGGYNYAVSANGTLVYVPAAAAAIRRAVIWVDRQGRDEALTTEPRAYQYPRFSRDGRFVALDMRDQLNDVWMWDLERSTLTRVTVNRRAGGPAIWTHDGRGVIFAPDIAGSINLHVQEVSGGPPQRLTDGPSIKFADVLTPDGQTVIFTDIDPKTRSDVRMLRLIAGATSQDLVKTPFAEQNPHLSPDGRWLAYQSDESGRLEVYVRPFPDVSTGRWQVSTQGGTRPLWGRDGRELFYLDPMRRMTAVPVSQSPTLAFGRPVTLFETAQFGLEGQQRNFDLAPDGKRFLMVKNLPAPADVPSLVLIQNWFEDLRAKVP